ncbi:MAG: hypothetical protein ACR2KK_09395, partial [Acidimicrobiales bacterium]
MKFKLSGNLLRFSGFRHEVEVAGSTVHEGIEALLDDLPDLRPVLMDGQGRVRAAHRMFFNGEALAADELSQSKHSGPRDLLIRAESEDPPLSARGRVDRGNGGGAGAGRHCRG